MHYYDFNIGEYAKKTQHLTNEEDLAYRRALDLYYDTEKPLDTTGLATLSRRLRVDEQALKNVLDEFFPGGVNKHAEEKIAAYYAYIAKQQANGKLGGRPKRKPKEPTANPPLTQAKASAKPPLPTTHYPVKKEPDAYASVHEQFDRFWNSWPKSQRKVDKAKCLKAWGKKRLDDLTDQIIAHVQAMSQTEQWRSGYEPAPLTYLNGERWQDPLPEQDYGTDAEAVFDQYNETLASIGWPEAVKTPYSAQRASAIMEFLSFSQNRGWVAAYFHWLRENIPAKPGFGFDWAIRRESYLRAKEGNFQALREAA